MNLITKKIMLLALLGLYHGNCQSAAAARNNRFKVLVITRVVPTAVAAGFGLNRLMWWIDSSKSNEEFRAKVEASAEASQAHYTLQSPRQDAKAEAESLSNLTQSSTLAKEVARAKDDADLTRIRLREARKNSILLGVLGTLLTGAAGLKLAVDAVK